MLFIKQPENAEDIRTFCRRFGENIRVEYKGDFDHSVRQKLPAIVSSFANSLGGVLVIGISTNRGIPQEPFEGFQPAPRDELPLTVENICLGNINPPVFPRTTVVPSDIDGRVFLVIEVDESWEAPHAIENSKKVYVRTGDASNPYELAEVDKIIDLVRRRDEPLRLRNRTLSRSRTRASTCVSDEAPHVEVSIGPLYPRSAFCSREEVWQFLTETYYRGGHFFPFESFRRIEDGAAAFATDEFGQISNYGLILCRKEMERGNWEGQNPQSAQCFFLADLFHPTLKMLVCAAKFYARVGYRGNVEVRISVNNVQNEIIVFRRVRPWHFDRPENFRCLDSSVSTAEIVAAENLEGRRLDLFQDLLCRLCWSFWQSNSPFPTEAFRERIRENLQQMGI